MCPLGVLLKAFTRKVAGQYVYRNIKIWGNYIFLFIKFAGNKYF